MERGAGFGVGDDKTAIEPDRARSESGDF
jgi:hypothetical protein